MQHPLVWKINLYQLNMKIKEFKSILDLVIENKSSFEKIVIENKVKFYNGLEFSFYQACKQFEIYTSKKIRNRLIKNALGCKF